MPGVVTVEQIEQDNRSDEEIVQIVLNGHEEYFSILVRRYESKLQRYGHRFLPTAEMIEDIVQEVFIKVYQNLRSFQIHRRFSPWIYRIAHNEFVNSLKQRQRDPLPFFDPDVLFPHPISPDRPDSDVERKDMRRMLDRCINNLTLKYREPLILFYFEELDYEEISDILRIPISTVGVRLNRGRTQLRKHCSEKGFFP